MKFAPIITYFLLWVVVTTAVQLLLPNGWVVLPAVGGLALYFWINRDKPTPKGGAALGLLLIALSSLASCNPQLTTRNQQPVDSVQMVRAADGFDEPAPLDTVQVKW